MLEVMKRQTWVILAVVGGVLAMCCFGSFVLLVVAGSPEEGGRSLTSAAGSPLVGKWMNGSASPTEYRSLVTGDYAPPSGMGTLYEFKDDGSCTQYALLQTTTYSCTSSVFTASEDCSFAVEGSTLTVQLNGGVVRARMCGGEVKESEATVRSLRYQFRFENDGTNTWLVLNDESGDTRFHRSE